MSTWTNLLSDSIQPEALVIVDQQCQHHYIVDEYPTIYKVDSIGRKYRSYHGRCQRCHKARTFSTRPWLKGRSPFDLVSREDAEIAVAIAQVLALEHAEQVSSRIEELAYA